MLLTLTLGTAWLGYFGDKLPFYVGHNIIIIPLCAYFIYLTANINNGWIYKIFGNKCLKFLGEASYSFYLLQGVPIVLTKRYYDTIINVAPIFKHHGLLIFSVFLLASGLSSINYLLIEKPFRKKILNHYFNRVKARDIQSTEEALKSPA